MIRCVALCLLLGLSACGVPKTALRSDFGKYDNLRLSEVRENSAPQVVLNDELYVKHESDFGPRTVYEVFRRVLVTREAGLDYAVAHVPLPDPEESGDLVLLDAATRLPSGEIVPVRREDMVDHEVFRAGGQDRGVRMRSFAFPRATVGAVLDLRYVYDQPLYHTEIYLSAGVEFPVREARLEVDAIKGVPLKGNQIGFEYSTSKSKTHVRHVFRLREPYRGAPAEPLPPGAGEWMPMARMSLENDDRAAASLYVPFAGRDDSELADIGVAHLPQKERVMRIWQFVQEELEDRSGVVYRSEEHSIDRIIRNRRADADDRARVMISMLRAANITARPAFVAPAWAPQYRDSYLYRSIAREADVLVWVVLDDIWLVLDPHCDGCSAGEIAPEHHGRTALIVTSQVFGLVHKVDTHVLQGGPSWMREAKTSLELQLAKDGVRLVAGRWEHGGGTSAGLRTILARFGELDSDRAMRAALGLDEEGGTVKHDKTRPSAGPLITTAENVLLKSATYTEAPGRVTVTPEMLRSSTGLVGLGRARTLDLYLGTVSPWSSTYMIAPVGGCVWDDPPPVFVTSGEFARYNLEVTREGSMLKIVESMAFLTPRVPADRIGELGTFVGEVARARSRPLVCRGRSE